MEPELTRTHDPADRSEPLARRPGPGWARLVELIWFVTGLVDALLALRFVAKILGASASSAFVQMLYAVTEPLVQPFVGIFPASVRGPYVAEPATLVGIVIYSLIGFGLAALVRLLARPRPTAV